MEYKESIVEYMGKQSYKEAIARIDKTLITDCNRAYYLQLKGYCFFRLGNYVKTISLCKQALKGITEDEECYLLIGESYEYMNWFKDAENSFVLGLKINPDNSEIKSAYAYLLLKNGQVCEAYCYIIQAIRADPQNYIVNNYVVYFYLHKQSINFGSYGLIKDFVENSPKEIYQYIKAGKLSIENQRYKVALDNFEKAYLLNPENEVLADLLDELRLKSKAIYKPVLIIDIVGGWNGWSLVLASLAFVNLVILIIQKNSLLNFMFGFIFITWVLIGAYKCMLDLFYWKLYNWE